MISLSLWAGEPGRSKDILEWSPLPSLPDPRGFAGPFAGVSGDALLVAGGANFPDTPPWAGGSKKWYDHVYVLEQPDGLWRVAGSLPRPLGYGTSITLDEGVLCIGGSDAAQHYAEVFLLQWQAGRLATTPWPPLPQACAHLCGAKVGRTVYVAGGLASPAATNTLRTFWALDLAAPERGWRQLEPWPGPARMLAVAGSQAGSFLLCSGVDLEPGLQGRPARRYLRDAYRYQPGQGWRRLQDLPEPVAAAPSPGFAVGQSHVLIIGGDTGAQAARALELKEAHPGFSAVVWGYHTITDTWAVMGKFPKGPGPGMGGSTDGVSWPAVTIPGVVWRGDYILPTGEVRPGARTPRVWRAQAGPARADFGWVNYTALALYLLAMVGVGVACAARNKTTNDFFRGGQNIPWWAAGISIFATMLSSITFMAIPANAYSSGWNLFLANTYVFIMPVVVYVFLPFYRRLDVTSAYEYLERRFNLATRLVASLLFILFQVGRIAIVLYLPSLALATVSNFDVTACILIMGVLCILYTVLGGIEAVVWTDVIQTVVLAGGALFSLALVIARVDGGFGQAVQLAAAGDKFFQTVDWSWDIVSGTAWTLLLGSLFHNLFAYTASQDVVQRYFTTKDQKTAARAIWSNAALAIPAQALFFAIGTALFVYYKQHPQRLEPVFPTDAIFPLFITRELPLGLAGVIVAGIFAAAQSTLSSSLNSVATAGVTDFYRRFRPSAPDAACLRLARWITVATGLIGISTALWVAQANVRSLFEAFLNVIGLFGGTITGLFLLGIFSRSAHGTGALIGAVASAVVVLAVRQHVHFYVYAFTGIVSCLAIGWLVSRLCPGERKDLTGLTLGDQTFSGSG